MTNKITLSTIARDLGVSTATVSLALRDSPLVADITREKIKEAAAAAGYIYNRRAASLRTSRSGIVGLLVPDVMNPFFAEILHGIEAELGLDRQTFLLCNHRDSIETQKHFVETLLQFGADGVIMSPAIGTSPEDIAAMEAYGLPVVMIARWVQGAKVPVYRGDDKKGTYMVTNHLIEQGHNKIAFIGGKRETSTGADRLAGYLAALEKAGIEPIEELQMGSERTRKSGYDSVREMFGKNKQAATAIVCFNDVIAIGVINGLNSLGIIPGKDIAVTGYDDIAEAEITSPTLTSVWNGQQEAGRRAARSIMQIIKGDPDIEDNKLIEPKLRIRESSITS
ncbi:MAG: LacI family DNA-binding transcriptional regulator [Nitratireductor sp.]